MKRRERITDRIQRLARAPRLYYAVVPLALPLILATITPPSPPVPQVTIPLAAPLAIDESLLKPTAPRPLPDHPIHLVAEDGDTIDSILLAGGLTSAESRSLIEGFAPRLDPRRLRPGQRFRFDVSPGGVVTNVSARISGWGDLNAHRTSSGFSITADESPVRKQEIVVSAEIDSSLYEAVRDQGEGPELVQSLVDVFQWDVDFFRLQDGDRFTLLAEKTFAGEEPTGYGPILAARFEHKGEVYEAFRYEDADGHAGYYTSTGTPMRKQFLKAPLRFSRITSGFTQRRFHPLLKVFRPHHGVDYGAPVGTPVMATADGVVINAEYDSGEGNYVRLKHNARLQTSYLHLSRFAKGIKRGASVRQGDIIGYVGMTGLATGPHLDYRVSDGGDWINPLKLRSVTADPLHGAALAEFHRRVARNISRIATERQRLASVASDKPSLF